MVIVMPRWAPDFSNVDTTDASSMGVVMAVYLKTKIGTLMVISTYWPSDCNPDGNKVGGGNWTMDGKLQAKRNLHGVYPR